MDDRKKLRRLAKLGIIGHQPSIAECCKMSEEEREIVVDGLLQQEVGNNPKVMKQYRYHRKREEGNQASCPDPEHEQTCPPLLMKHAKVLVTATVQWNRKRRMGMADE